MKKAENCTSKEDWLEWATFDRVARLSYGLLPEEQMAMITPDDLP